MNRSTFERFKHMFSESTSVKDNFIGPPGYIELLSWLESVKDIFPDRYYIYLGSNNGCFLVEINGVVEIHLFSFSKGRAYVNITWYVQDDLEQEMWIRELYLYSTCPFFVYPERISPLS